MATAANQKPSAAQIKSWKQTHGSVYHFSVIKDKKEINGYFKAPSMDTIMAMAEFAESDKAKALSILYTNTKIQVDPEVDTDDPIRLSMMKNIQALWKNYTVRVKKL